MCTGKCRVGVTAFEPEIVDRRARIGVECNVLEARSAYIITKSYQRALKVRAAAQSDERYQMAAGAVVAGGSAGAVTTGLPAPPTVRNICPCKQLKPVCAGLTTLAQS